MRARSLVHLVAPALLAGCGTTEFPVIQKNLPDADLEVDNVDFGDVEWGETPSRQVVLKNTGEVPMGIASIAMLEEGMETNFTLSWSIDNATCPEETTDGEAKDMQVDTGGLPSDDTGVPSDDTGGGEGETTDELAVLCAGGKLPVKVTFDPDTVGEVHAAFAVITATEDVEEGDPAYFRDPDQFKKVVLLSGSTSRGEGNIVVKSPTTDLGHHYVGETSTQQIYVFNVGSGDLTVGEPVLAEDCDTAFSLDLSQMKIGEAIAAGDSTLFEAVFTPEDLDSALCDLVVPSDDTDTPEVEVTLRGNYGTDPENKRPTAAIRAPTVGYQHNSSEPLVVEVNIFDQNQPANTLYCKVKSYLAEASLADCQPSDESGHVFVEIPIDDLEQGTDTLRVQVTDQAENRAYASTTILWMSDYPDGDDDGDGWGDDDPDDTATWDCDDADKNVYPYAAEIYDGKDNDCDGGIDEDTEGADDDGDSLSEKDGDCDDSDANTYPSAPEQPDLKDNDCDGEIDEGTSFADDDGDGFSETDYDCDDDDPAINPAAEEYCDGIDNNCNGLKDHQEGCIEIASQPSIVGGIRMTHTAIGAGESTTMTVYVYDADGQAVSYTWQEDTDLTSRGHTAIDNSTAQTITWTAPKELENDNGEVFSVYVIVMDEDGNQDWAFDEIWVYPETVATTFDEIVVEDDKSGCGSSGSDTAAAAALPALSLFGLFAMARRRRDGED